MSHIIDQVCDCEFCQMIDVMMGDPMLSRWEREFLDSVAQQGWHHNYSENQKAKVRQMYAQQRAKYARVTQ